MKITSQISSHTAEIRRVAIPTVIVLTVCIVFSLNSRAAPAKNHVINQFNFVTIPAGEFIMGTSNLKDALADLPGPEAAMIKDETPAHKVIFEKPFQLSRTEVTQELWFSIMHSKPGPAENWQSNNWKQLPAVSISWQASQQFIEKLNQQSSSRSYRLPTEAEWEYAARAGSTGLRPFSRLAMDEYAWYLLSSNDTVQPVAQLKANNWGLFDMLGNVWEWTADWYHPLSYKNAKAINPQGPESGNKKIRRGGSFHCPPHLIRPAYRAADSIDKAYSVLGFRLISEIR